MIIIKTKCAKKAALLFFVLFNISLGLLAQNDFRKGYIINLNNDTIHGTIDYQGDSRNSKVCRFKSDSNVLTEYAPNEILSFRFVDSGKLYVSRNIKTSTGQKDLFLEYLIKGKLNVFYYRDLLADHYLVQKDTLNIIELPPLERLVEVEGTKYMNENHATISILELITNDCPEIKTKISKIYLEQKPLIEFATAYNNKVCGNGSCVIYAKKPYPITFLVEPTISYVKYNSKVSMLTSSNPQYGVIIQNWIPRTNEKLFIKTGLLVNNVTMSTTNQIVSGTIYRVPLMFEYQYPKGKLRPTFGAGWNLVFDSEEESGIYVSTPIDLGLDYKINERIVLATTFTSEFSNITSLIGPDNKFVLISNYLSLGLKIKL